VPFEYKKWRENQIEQKKEQEELVARLKSLSEDVISIRDNVIEGAEGGNNTIDREWVQAKMVSIADDLQALRKSNPDMNSEVGSQIDQLVNACTHIDDFIWSVGPSDTDVDGFILAIGPTKYENFNYEVGEAAERAEELKQTL
jgi:hypothetical protein